jgi:hypothetical protein
MTHLGRVALLLILLGYGSAACASSYARSSFEPNALIPLAVGNSWSYAQVGGIETATAEVLKSEHQMDSSWFLYKEFGDIFWLKNDEGDQVEAINAFGTRELPHRLEEEIIFYSPGEGPTAYKISGGHIQYNSCEEQLTVPAGTFPCHAYTIDLGDGISSVNYYSPGVGLIRNEFATDTGTVIFELTEYRVK